MADRLSVRIVSAERQVYAGSADGLVAPAWDGAVGVLPGHAPMIVLLGGGMLELRGASGGVSSLYVAGGTLKVEENEVVVLTEFTAEREPEGGPPAGIVPDPDTWDEEEDSAPGAPD